MQLLTVERRQQLVQVLHSAYYTKHIKAIYRLFVKSRDSSFWQNPANLLAFQMALARHIGKIEGLVKEAKKRIKEFERQKNQKSIEAFADGLNKNRELVRVYRTISDGIGWRLLGFDRPFLRIMAELKKPFGSVQLDHPSYETTEIAASYIVQERGSYVLLNDITNFLTLGDITEIGEETILYELKVKDGKKFIFHSAYTEAKKKKGQQTSKQLKNIITAQIARDYRDINMPNGDIVKIREVPIKYRHYLDEVQKIIYHAKRKTIYSEQLSEYLWVFCSDQEKLINRSIKEKRNVWEDFKGKHPFAKGDIILAFSNLDTFFYDDGGDFFRTITPYTVFPFHDYDVMHLISGRLFLQAVLNISAIERIIRLKEWEVELVDIDEQLKNYSKIAKQPYKGKLFERSVESYMFKVSRGAFYMQIPQSWILRISSDFMKLECVLDYLEYIYQNAKPGKNEQFESTFLNEADTWR